jgi:hypothetical protein
MIPVDGWGITGLVLDYAVIIFFSLGSLILFTFCWWKKRLDFDEGPKYQMLEEDPPYE